MPSFNRFRSKTPSLQRTRFVLTTTCSTGLTVGATPFRAQAGAGKPGKQGKQKARR